MLFRYLTAGTTFVSGVGYVFAKDTFKLLKQRRQWISDRTGVTHIYT